MFMLDFWTPMLVLEMEYICWLEDALKFSTVAGWDVSNTLKGDSLKTEGSVVDRIQKNVKVLRFNDFSRILQNKTIDMLQLQTLAS